MSLFYCNLKTSQVDLPKSPFIYHCIHSHAPLFLAVYCKMFGACIHSLALDAPHISSCHFSCKIRIFGKIFKVSSAKRTSFHIKPRSQYDIDILGCCLFSQCFSNLFPKVRIPAVSDSRRCRKTGCL